MTELERVRAWARLWKLHSKLGRKAVRQALRILGAWREPETIGARLRNYIYYQHALARLSAVLYLLDDHPELKAKAEAVMADPPKLECEKCLTNQDWMKAYYGVQRELAEAQAAVAKLRGEWERHSCYPRDGNDL